MPDILLSGICAYELFAKIYALDLLPYTIPNESVPFALVSIHSPVIVSSPAYHLRAD